VPRPRPRLIPVLFCAVGLATAAVAGQDEKAGGKPPAPAKGAEETKKTADLTPEERAKRLLAAEEELARNLGQFKTLRAEFVQRKHLEVFHEDVESRGTLSLEVPGKLRWEFTSPVKTVLVVNGDRGKRERTSRKGVKTVTRFALADEPVVAGTAGQVFLWTRGDFKGAAKDYAIELLEETPLRIRATPRDAGAARVVASVELRFADDRKSLVEVILQEAVDARTVISFSAIERDPELPKDSFEIGE